MKAVFWDVAPCRYCVNQRFGGTYRLHLQVRRQEEIRDYMSQIEYVGGDCIQLAHGMVQWRYLVDTAINKTQGILGQLRDCQLSSESEPQPRLLYLQPVETCVKWKHEEQVTAAGLLNASDLTTKFAVGSLHEN
jgi:hypothetical protein